jgi:hypothetical protein
LKKKLKKSGAGTVINTRVQHLVLIFHLKYTVKLNFIAVSGALKIPGDKTGLSFFWMKNESSVEIW